MTLTDVYRRSGRTSPVISYELFPPRVPDPHSAPWAGIVKLLNSRPEYVSVTFGASGSSQELSRTVLRQVLQRTGRPGLAHLTCVGRNRQQLDRLISELIAEGARDFLALRGDPTSWPDPLGVSPRGIIARPPGDERSLADHSGPYPPVLLGVRGRRGRHRQPRRRCHLDRGVSLEDGYLAGGRRPRFFAPAGIWDIHSPRIPTLEEEVALLRAATAALDPRQLWVNPDCGLKTRAYPETIATLRNLVAAAAEVRDEVSS
ncbi:Cobalamin-independent synthase, Catalytic domain [Bowdeniella nasicola]|uniref:Methylenetetrahydrofolate reductase n=1 Tax=Bowdeniella nasicola TaxID=208480 RepID=A0A1H4CEM1_9ACTO|nr:Cobalamin-independent synthase, Catalytic domain [Bowdeniella nasicola]